MTLVQKRAVAKAPPPIHISEVDYDRIADMALRIERSAPDLSHLILDEIDRAHIYTTASLPKNVVALGSEVEFFDASNGKKRRVKLVLPSEANIEKGHISIMTPVGAGLIGMSLGGEISWPRPDGRPRILKILKVEQQPW